VEHRATPIQRLAVIGAGSLAVRIAIADDESLARARLQRLLARISDATVVAECADGEALLQALGTQDVDLLLLDIQMPGINAFDVLERIPRDRSPLVVFVTAHDRYATRAFEVHAFDYLLKPVRPDRLRAAVERARGTLQANRGDLQVLAQLRDLRRDLGLRGAYLERLSVTIGRRHVVLSVDECDWIEAADNYARLYQHGKSYLYRAALSDLERQLDPRRFVRIHRSVIVNVDRIRQIVYTPSGDGTVTLANGNTVKLSRSYRAHLAELIG
jgi:two-component system LytT family response regulator